MLIILTRKDEMTMVITPPLTRIINLVSELDIKYDDSFCYNYHSYHHHHHHRRVTESIP